MQSILVTAGDGIGPEVVEATLFAMDGLGLDFELIMEPVGLAGLQESTAHGHEQQQQREQREDGVEAHAGSGLRHALAAEPVEGGLKHRPAGAQESHRLSVRQDSLGAVPTTRIRPEQVPQDGGPTW